MSRLQEYYKMRSKLPKHGRTFVKTQPTFLNQMSEEEFEFYLNFEYEFALSNNLSERKCAMNPFVSSYFHPNKPTDKQGNTIPGSHEFDSIPESYMAEPLDLAGKIYEVWKFTKTDQEFLDKVDWLFCQGYINSIGYQDLMDKCVEFLQVSEKRKDMRERKQKSRLNKNL